MKKLLFVFAVAAALVSCDNNGSGDANKDSANNADTQNVAPLTPDTGATLTPDTNNATGVDTTKTK